MSDNKKVVLFDWGGVIDSTDHDNSYTSKKVLIDALRHAYHFELSCCSDDEIWDRLYEYKYYELNKGFNSRTEFKQKLKEIFYSMYPVTKPPEGCLTEFIEYSLQHYKYVRYYQDIIDFIYSLKFKCEIGLMSDVDWLGTNRLTDQVDLNKFDYVLLSCEQNAIKYDGSLFEVADHKINLPDRNIMLIDDKQNSVDWAIKHNWQTYKCGEHDIIGIKSAVSSFLCYS